MSDGRHHVRVGSSLLGMAVGWDREMGAFLCVDGGCGSKTPLS